MHVMYGSAVKGCMDEEARGLTCRCVKPGIRTSASASALSAAAAMSSLSAARMS
jgi:hypothetical protein